MADITTIARPYAKAVFELAVDTRQLGEWSAVLVALSQAVLMPASTQFINNPAVTTSEQQQLLMAVVSRLKSNVDIKLVEHFISLLATYKRLLLIPAIHTQFEQLKAEQEKTLTVNVSCFSPLTATQQEQLIKKLTNRLQREVSLEFTIDKSLLGGALIQAGDLVIDGSVRGQLSKLAHNLIG